MGTSRISSKNIALAAEWLATRPELFVGGADSETLPFAALASRCFADASVSPDEPPFDSYVKLVSELHRNLEERLAALKSAEVQSRRHGAR